MPSSVTSPLRVLSSALALAVIALVAASGTAHAYGYTYAIPGSTTACTASAQSYAQTVSYAKTTNLTGCNQVQARMRYNNGTFGPWVNGGSGTAIATSSSNTTVGGSHRRCLDCASHHT